LHSKLHVAVHHRHLHQQRGSTVTIQQTSQHGLAASTTYSRRHQCPGLLTVKTWPQGRQTSGSASTSSSRSAVMLSSLQLSRSITCSERSTGLPSPKFTTTH